MLFLFFFRRPSGFGGRLVCQVGFLVEEVMGCRFLVPFFVLVGGVRGMMLLMGRCMLVVGGWRWVVEREILLFVSCVFVDYALSFFVPDVSE